VKLHSKNIVSSFLWGTVYNIFNFNRFLRCMACSLRSCRIYNLTPSFIWLICRTPSTCC